MATLRLLELAIARSRDFLTRLKGTLAPQYAHGLPPNIRECVHPLAGGLGPIWSGRLAFGGDGSGAIGRAAECAWLLSRNAGPMSLDCCRRGWRV